MNLYRMQNFIYFPKDKALALMNECDEEIGSFGKVEKLTCEKNHVFCYKPAATQEEVVVGIHKSGFKRLLKTEYEVSTSTASYRLSEKVGNNILYFCVTGQLEGQTVLIEENWSGNLEVKVNRKKVAYIKQTSNEFSTFYQIEEEIDEHSILFATILLFSFMFRIYKQESDFIEGLLKDGLE